MKRALLFITMAALQMSIAQARPAFPQARLVNAEIAADGELKITPSATSSKHDFDFLKGNWTMDNQKLKERLSHSNEWESFESTDENQGPILDGLGDIDILSATLDGKLFEGLTLRLFNPKNRLWSLYWVDSNTGVLDPPVVGSFEGNVGWFYARHHHGDIPVIMMFMWDKSDPDNPVWSQAFSPDNGKTWEWNWWNVSHRAN